MLKWITGSKVDHPLADPKEARTLIADLPANDPTRTLEEITSWLDSLARTEGFKLDRLFDIIDDLDTAGRSAHRKIVSDYLAMSRQQKYQENRLWTSGYNFSKALAAAYLECARQHQRGAAGASALKKQMPVVVSRALRALALQAKWTMLRYGPFEPGLWTSMGELYGYAAKGGYARTPLTVYPGAQGTGTVEHDYLKIMMLWASSADALPPVSQEIADRASSRLADSFRLETAPFQGATYRFDPAQNRPPSRLFQAPAGTAQLHYFGPGTAATKIAEAVASAERSGKVPAELNPGGIYPEEAVLAVLRHLAAYWSDKPPARLSERRQASARITVVPGYSQLIDELERNESDALNFSPSGAESWVVENVSENGYGAIIPGATTEWIRVGELIGLQLEGAPHWSVGAVRRVTRDEHRRYRVGIEVVASEVRLARIVRAGAREQEPAVLLAADAEPGAQVGVLVRAGRFDPNHDMTLLLGDRELRMKPAGMITAADDFDWASYSVSPAA